MKTTIFSLSTVLLLVISTLFFFPGCNKSGEMPAISKGAIAGVKSAKADTPVMPPVQYITVPLTGDQITLVPHYYKSPTADSSYIYFMAKPKNSYCFNSVLEFSNNLDNNGNYTLSFLDVKEKTTDKALTLMMGRDYLFAANYVGGCRGGTPGVLCHAGF